MHNLFDKIFSCGKIIAFGDVASLTVPRNNDCGLSPGHDELAAIVIVACGKNQIVNAAC
jgi:hypothetical protein